MVAVLGTRVHNGDATFDLGHKIITIVERSIRKWVLWISFYNIKFKSIWPIISSVILTLSGSYF